MWMGGCDLGWTAGICSGSLSTSAPGAARHPRLLSTEVALLPSSPAPRVLQWRAGPAAVSPQHWHQDGLIPGRTRTPSCVPGEAKMGEITATSVGSHGTSKFSLKMECKASQIFTLLLWTVLSIAMIIIGSMHVDNCPIEPKIPIYLIVAGVFHLLAFALIPLKIVAEKLAYSIESVLGIFSFSWFIAGSVWVFRIYQENPRRCNDLVYKFAFGILIFEYIFLALLVAVICLFCFCAGVLVASSSETPAGDHSPEDEEALK